MACRSWAKAKYYHLFHPTVQRPCPQQSPVVLGVSHLCMHSLSHPIQGNFWRNLTAVPEGFWSPGGSSALYSAFLWKPLSTECQKSLRKQHLFTAVLTCRTAWVKSKSPPSSGGIWAHHHTESVTTAAPTAEQPPLKAETILHPGLPSTWEEHWNHGSREQQTSWAASCSLDSRCHNDAKAQSHLQGVHP